MTTTETEILDVEPQEITLANGQVLTLQRMKTRQFFRMLRILTRGAPELMPSIASGATGNDPEQFAMNLAAMLIYAIPEAEEPTLAFVKSMVVYPPDVAEAAKLDIYLDNPELEDLLTIVEAILKREAGDLTALGKRLQAMMSVAEKTGQTKPKSSKKEPSLTT